MPKVAVNDDAESPARRDLFVSPSPSLFLSLFLPSCSSRGILCATRLREVTGAITTLLRCSRLSIGPRIVRAQSRGYESPVGSTFEIDSITSPKDALRKWREPFEMGLSSVMR